MTGRVVLTFALSYPYINLFGTKLRCFGTLFFSNKLHKDYYLKNLRPYYIHFIVFAIHHSISQKLKDTFRDRKAQTRLPSCTPQGTTALLTVVHTVKEHPVSYDCFPEKKPHTADGQFYSSFLLKDVNHQTAKEKRHTKNK